MDKIFSKKHTMNAKGIAIILMCIHHLFSTNLFLTVITKVCVSIFTILSGYGLNESYKRNKDNTNKFVWKHIKKLMINYWYVFIPMVLLSIIWYIVPKGPFVIYGSGVTGVVNFLLDFLGLRAFLYTPSINNTWWYMEAILCCYILFPIIRKGINKKKVLTFIVLLIPNIIAIFNEKILITTDRELFYLLPFAIGIFCSEKGIFNKLVELSINNKVLYITISIPILIISAVFATKVKLIGNIFYATSIISMSIWLLSNFNNICKMLILLGKHSMNIFLSHSFFYIYLIPGMYLMKICKVPILKLIVLISISLFFSFIIEKVKKFIYDFKDINNRKQYSKTDNDNCLKEKEVVSI